MRRRLQVLVLAVTALSVVAFTGPLAVLVWRQADARARSRAERDAQAVAANLVFVLTASDRPLTLEEIDDRLQLPPGLAVVSEEGEAIGASGEPTPLVAQTIERREALSAYTAEGWELALPVITRSGTLAVQARVEEGELRRGVGSAWAVLAGVGLVVIGTGLLLARRLGRTLMEPVASLAGAARRLGEGDLDTRVEVTDPEELAIVADAFNRLAPQLRHLLRAEREAMADLSHRLRTPLTSLRLQAETIADPTDRAEVLAQVDRMQRAVDELIVEVRRLDARVGCDLVEVAAKHCRFWEVLAEEQRREFRWRLPEGPVVVPVEEAELGSVIDALIGNVFDHTPAGTGFELVVEADGSGARLRVADAGPGFPADRDVVRRGTSGGGSTGLGLDIARRVAERTGGGLRLGRADAGGAVVEVTLGG